MQRYNSNHIFIYAFLIHISLQYISRPGTYNVPIQ